MTHPFLKKTSPSFLGIPFCTTSLQPLHFFYLLRKRDSLLMITEGVKKREFAANYEGSYSDYSDAFSTNTPLLPPCPLLPPRQ